MNQWVVDDEKTRSFHEKRLLIKKYGVFTMRVTDTDSDGNKKTGHVIVSVEPYDLDAALNFGKLEEYFQQKNFNINPAP